MERRLVVAAETWQLMGRWAGGLDQPRHPGGRLGGLIVLMLLASCQKPPIDDTDAPGLKAPRYVTLAEAHNARIDRLGTIYARGVIELRWTDDDGKHVEQGDLDLWIALPHQTALNISKFGERLMWLGSDDRQSWLFDFRGDEKVLYRATGDQRSDDRADAQLPIDPTALLRLSGLIRLPPRASTVLGPSMRAASSSFAGLMMTESMSSKGISIFGSPCRIRRP